MFKVPESELPKMPPSARTSYKNGSSYLPVRPLKQPNQYTVRGPYNTAAYAPPVPLG